MKTLLECLREGEAPPFDVIDVHGHVGRYAYPIPDLTTKGLVDVMNRAGVVKIICSHMQCMSADTDWGNGEVLQHMEASNGRVLGYISVFPSSPEAVADSVARWWEAGFTGLKFHDINQFRYDDDAYQPAYELANEHHLPVLLHVWGQAVQLNAARSMAEKYPDLTIILAHGGSNNPDGYIETAKACPNVVIDTCVSRSALGMVEYLVNGAGPDKIVFGSDCYFYSLTQQLGKIMGAELDDATKKAILHDNAERILGRIRP